MAGRITTSALNSAGFNSDWPGGPRCSQVLGGLQVSDSSLAALSHGEAGASEFRQEFRHQRPLLLQFIDAGVDSGAAESLIRNAGTMCSVRPSLRTGRTRSAPLPHRKLADVTEQTQTLVHIDPPASDSCDGAARCPRWRWRRCGAGCPAPLMMAAPRCCTVEMNSPFNQAFVHDDIRRNLAADLCVVEIRVLRRE